jgi:hypothetical protein
MSRTPAPPIIVDDNGDIEVYTDVASACCDLEVYDVHDLAVSDSLGYRLLLETRAYAVTDMVIVEGAEPDPLELANRLRDYIARVGPERIGLPDYEDSALDVLLEALLQFFAAGPTYERGWRAGLDGFWRMARGR